MIILLSIRDEMVGLSRFGGFPILSGIGKGGGIQRTLATTKILQILPLCEFYILKNGSFFKIIIEKYILWNILQKGWLCEQSIS